MRACRALSPVVVILLWSGVAALGACDQNEACYDMYVGGVLHVSVVEYGTGDRICNATVVAVAGSRTVELKNSNQSPCYYGGIGDGDQDESTLWHVTATAPGYSAGSTSVVVPEHDCHVGRADAVIELH